MIEPSRFDAGTAYLVVDAHRLDDMRPYLWKTADLGRTWKRLDGGLPRDVYLHAVREDPARKGLLYLGTRARRRLLPGRRRHLAARCGSTCPPWPCTTSRSRTTAWWSAPTAGRSGSSTTSPLVRAPAAAGGRRAQDVHLFPAPDAVRWTCAAAAADAWAGQNPPRGARAPLLAEEGAQGGRHARGAGRRRHAW